MCKIGVEICFFFLKLADLNSSNKIGADADGCLKWQPCFRQNGRALRRCSELEHPNLSSRIWELWSFYLFGISTATITIAGCGVCEPLVKLMFFSQYVFVNKFWQICPARFWGSYQLWWRMSHDIHWFSPEKKIRVNRLNGYTSDLLHLGFFVVVKTC